MNPEIVYNLQEIFNLLPDQDTEDMVQSFATQTNDMMLALYLGSMLRSTLALHNLINNKIKNKKIKEDKGKDKKEKKEGDDKEKDNDTENEKGNDKEKDKDK